jgi:hypothetical protein
MSNSEFGIARNKPIPAGRISPSSPPPHPYSSDTPPPPPDRKRATGQERVSSGRVVQARHTGAQRGADAESECTAVERSEVPTSRRSSHGVKAERDKEALPEMEQRERTPIQRAWTGMRNLVSYVLPPKWKRTETDNRLRRETSDDSEISESPDDAELVELYEAGEHGAPSSKVSDRSEPDRFQVSPRPPSLTVDDMRKVSQGNLTPEPWEPPVSEQHEGVQHQGLSKRLSTRETDLKTMVKYRDCSSPTVDQMAKGLSKADVCSCRGTGVHGKNRDQTSFSVDMIR